MTPMMIPAQAQQAPIMVTFFAERMRASQNERKVKRVSALNRAMNGMESVAILAQKLTLRPMHMAPIRMMTGPR